MENATRRKLTKAERTEVYNKTNGHCAYCGCEIPFKGFNADHVECFAWNGPEADNVENMLPSCGSCNNYKHTMSLENFREELGKIPDRLQRDVSTYKIAKRYGMVTENREPIKFYFEKIGLKIETKEIRWCDWYGCCVETAKNDGTEKNCNFYGYCDGCSKNVRAYNPKLLQEETNE